MKDFDLEKERDEGGDDTELKVTDRRLFDADGRLRAEVEMGAEEAAQKAREAEEKQRRRETMLKQAETGPIFAFGFWRGEKPKVRAVDVEEDTEKA